MTPYTEALIGRDLVTFLPLRLCANTATRKGANYNNNKKNLQPGRAQFVFEKNFFESKIYPERKKKKKTTEIATFLGIFFVDIFFQFF